MGTPPSARRIAGASAWARVTLPEPNQEIVSSHARAQPGTVTLERVQGYWCKPRGRIAADGGRSREVAGGTSQGREESWSTWSATRERVRAARIRYVRIDVEQGDVLLLDPQLAGFAEVERGGGPAGAVEALDGLVLRVVEQAKRVPSDPTASRLGQSGPGRDRHSWRAGRATGPGAWSA